MKPNSPIHRVKANSIRVYSSLDNVTYTRVDGWKLVPKEKGGLEIVLGTPVTARYVKVKSLFDDRDEEFNPVNAATFQNAPQELIMVYYLL